MKLLTKKLRAQLPKLHSTKIDSELALTEVKFFLPNSNLCWYPIEFDGHDTFFGAIIEDEAELGYFSLAELKAMRGPQGQSVKRDPDFEPTRLVFIKLHHIAHGVGL